MRKFVILMALLVGVSWFDYGEAARATGPMTLTGFICAKASEGTKCLGDYPAGGGSWDGPEAAVALEVNDQALVFLTSGLAVYKYATGSISDDASNTPPLTVAASGGGGWNLQAINPSSMTIPKTSGTAGASCVYDGNSTDTDQTCWEGAANRSGNLTLKHSNSDPAANQFMLFPAPTTGSSTYTWTTYGQMGALPVNTTGEVTGLIKVLSLSSSCTIGSDCDSTSVKVAYGGIILATAAITITLPEIVASPSATQVGVGASICIIARDASEALVVDPHANDSISLCNTGACTKDTAGDSITATQAGAKVCLVAVEADNWMDMGTRGTWTAN